VDGTKGSVNAAAREAGRRPAAVRRRREGKPVSAVMPEDEDELNLERERKGGGEACGLLP
jgi:hypothetical protein